MKLSVVTLVVTIVTCNGEIHRLFDGEKHSRNLQECVNEFADCSEAACCAGFSCESSPIHGNICIKEAECNCNGCETTCPKNSAPMSNLCPRSFDDCDCAPGYMKQGNSCICEKECPANSKLRNGVNCARSIKRHCVCKRGFRFVGNECQCRYACPAHSTTTKVCPRSFNDCECDMGRYKNNGSCEVDVVLEWNLAGIRANVVDHGGREAPGDELSCTQGPPRAALQLAGMHLAMFDAYNSIDPQYEEYLTRVRSDTVGEASTTAAAAQAAHDFLIARYPAQAGFFEAKLEESLNRVPLGPSRDEGIEIGRAAAAAVLKQREEDLKCEYGDYKYESPDVIPAHQDDPIYAANQVPTSPALGKTVKPFIAKSIERFTGNPPPNVTSQEYTDAFNQVKTLGANGVDSETTRDYEGTVIAWYHSYNASPGLGTPSMLLNEVARVVAKQQGLTPVENLRLFALVNVAMANGGIASWREKFDFNFWRPVVGIRSADRDNNPDTEVDPDWVPLAAARSNPFEGECNFSPPFPAYTSGHATFCGAGMKALINFFGTNDIQFDFVSKEFNGRTFDDHGRVRPLLIQTFKTLSVFSSQCAASRVFNGVHWLFDGSVGARQGYKIADFVFENALRPIGETSEAFNNVPNIKREIQRILSKDIKVRLKSPEGDDVKEIVEAYLASPAKRQSCRGAPN